jgi:hypothetical protein
MKLPPRLALALLALAVGASSALAWSARIGRRVWSPAVWAWRDFLKEQPVVAEQPGAPVRIVGARFYSFMSLGSSVGSVLTFDVENVSRKPIHSFTLSHHSPDPVDTGSGGYQPEAVLKPGQSEAVKISVQGKGRMVLVVDFVQFADGSTWYSNPPQETVKPEGVRAGARASVSFLRGVLESRGASAVMEELPRIHADVMEPDFSTADAYGHFGFYCGVTNTAVRVQRAYDEGALPGVEAFLRKRE